MRKYLYKSLIAVIAILCLISLFSIDVNASIGYTYDHKGKPIYSTEGFTVNQTPYIYSDLGLDNIKKLANPTDLFVYEYDEEVGTDLVHNTIVYLLDGSKPVPSDQTAFSRLYMLDDKLQLNREIEYFVYDPNELTDRELSAMKSFGKPVIVEYSNLNDAKEFEADKYYKKIVEENGQVVYELLTTEPEDWADNYKLYFTKNEGLQPTELTDPSMADVESGFKDFEDIRRYDKVKLHMIGASAVYRMYKTNSIPYTDYLYICDSENNQVLVVDATSYDETLKTYKIVQVIVSPTEEIGSATFRPVKVTADAAGRIYVIANGITNGIMEFSVDGTFDRYIGTNYVSLSAWDIFWRNFSTESQLSAKTSILPTTFTSMTYKNNMIYTTSFAVTASGATNDTIMIKKINPSGKDVLRRNGYTVPKGDFLYNRVNDGYGVYGPSTLCGITVNEYGVYTVVDSNRGRLFTYDNEGNLLYISGGKGQQIDKVSIPEAIQYLGSNILVLDSYKKAIIVFEPTDIASVINQAIKCEYEGRNEGEWIDDDNDDTTPKVYVKGAYDYWEEVILLNANYEYAYVGIGKHYLNNKEYKKAMEYFKLGYDRNYYSNAYKLYRDSVIKANFAWVFIVLVVIIVGSVVTKKIIKKKKGIVEEEMTGIGDE